MSQETRRWLAENVLVGYTDKRGRAWHWRAGDTNHYSGPVPVEDVEARLFSWTADESELYVPTATGYTQVPGRKAIVRSDTGTVLGVFKDSYTPHQPTQWLIDNVATMLDSDLGIGSAGLLRGGAQAFVSVEVPDTLVTSAGVEYRPNLLAVTSFDGSLATTYKRCVTNVVCDNTMYAGLAERGQVFKVKHSSKSLTRVGEARRALDIMYAMTDEFSAEVERLTNITVSDAQFVKIIEAEWPQPPADASPRSQTIWCNRRSDLTRLWHYDERVSPWHGTAWGVIQAFNTFHTHEEAKSGNLVERAYVRAIGGQTEQTDRRLASLFVAA
jgi:phage/plasmid-like protein (TIGR03299 family)